MKFTCSYPVTPVSYNQHFGTNGAYYQTNGINVLGHNGCDLRAFHGQPVHAAHDGMAFYEEDDSAGHGVVIISDQPYDYKGQLAFFKTIYWHLANPVKEPKYASPIYLALNKKINSGKGVKVKKGDIIGYADNTGLSTGDHLHFGLKPIDKGTPPKRGDAPDVNIGFWVNVEQENGYLGAIDPEPYFEGSAAPPALPPYTSVSYEQALENLRKSGLSGISYSLATWILKNKYNR